jgi:hypothetical protein
MSEATKEVFKKVGLWIWYAFIPTGVIYFATGELLFNAFALYPSLWLVILFAICLSVMDSIENEHILDTYFAKLNKSFWSKRDSWNKAIRIGGYKLDAWHLVKSLSIILIVLAIIYSKPMTEYKWLDLLVYGYYYNITFNGFYNCIFTTKKSI